MYRQNQVLITGVCGGELEITAMPQDRMLASFSIAYDHVYQNAAKHTRTYTEWFRVVSSNPYFVNQVLPDIIRKGQRVFIHGKLQTSTFNNQKRIEIWIDNDGGIDVVGSDLHINRASVSGNLAAAADIKIFPDDKKAAKKARMGVYVTRGYRDAQGNWPADLIPVVTRQPTLVDKILAKQATKGRLVYVNGGLRARAYTDQKTGETKTSFEIEVQEATGILPIPTIKHGGRDA